MRSHAFCPTKKLSLSKNEQRPQASFLCARSVQLPPLWKVYTRRNRSPVAVNKMGKSQKACQVKRSNKKSQICGCVAVDRVENGEISLVANKMRSPTPKCTHEWAFRTMTASALWSSQSKIPDRKRARLRKRVNNGAEQIVTNPEKIN